LQLQYIESKYNDNPLISSQQHHDSLSYKGDSLSAAEVWYMAGYNTPRPPPFASSPIDVEADICIVSADADEIIIII